MPELIADFLPLGAIVQCFYVKGINIVQGFPEQRHYELYNTPFFGETTGRVANRIAGARIESLNYESVVLAKNDGENTLHGGNAGWGKKVWDGPKSVAVKMIPGIERLIGEASVELTLRDRSGNEGFPRTLEVSIFYTTGIQKDRRWKTGSSSRH